MTGDAIAGFMLAGAVAVEMLDWRLVPPGNLVGRHVEHGGDLLALGGTRRPTAENDGKRAAFVEAAALGQVADVEFMFAAEVGDGKHSN